MRRRALLRLAAATALVPVVGCRRDTTDVEAPGSVAPDATPGAGSTDAAEPPPPADPPSELDPDGPVGSDEEPADPEEPAPRPVRSVPVICRDALGLVGAGAGARPHTITQMTLHHTAVPIDGADAQVPQRLRGHQRFHQEQGWADVAYHLGVDRAGNVYELRDVDTAGDTFTDYDPAGHLLIVCEGDYDRDEPTEVQLERLAELFAHGAQTYGVAVETLGGHRDHASTACPGDGLYDRLAGLRTRTAQLVEEADIVLDAVCGPAGRDRIRAIEGSA